MNGPPLDTSQGIHCDPLTSDTSGVGLPPLDFTDMQPPPQQVPPQPILQSDMAYLDNMSIDEQFLQSDLDAWGNLDFENNATMNFSPEDQMNPLPLLFEPPVALSPISSGNTSKSSLSEVEIPLQTLKILHYAYFDIAHHAMPIINQDKFLSQLNKAVITPHVASLSHAMATLGASLMDGYAHIKDKCYQLACKYLEVCEREEDGASLMTIEALQACILITNYELRGKGFARAWMTLGRAIRLAQMMGLDRMDAPNPDANGALKFQQTLPPAQSQLDLEERRKAFWVLFIIDAYASLRSGTAVAIDESKVTTALPSPHKSHEAKHPPMPTLEHARLLYGTNSITSFTGLVLMVSLYRRCLSHTSASLETDSATRGPGYSFWECHFIIDKDLQECKDALVGNMDAQALLNDEFALGLDMNLCAIDIVLHEAAVLKADKDGLPRTLVTESNNRCSEAARRIVEGISLSQTLAQPRKTLFKQLGIFSMWPICMAMQVLNRQLSAINDDAEVGHAVGMLKILVSAIEDLEDVSGHWVSSISHIIKRLDDIDSTSMRTLEAGM
ncbi:MAG: hypothetical protein Q9208_005436 [Pyrenodesmia sp. 3 TL-2023]